MPGGATEAGGGRGVARTYYGKYPGLVLDRVPETDSAHHRGELLVQVPGILEEDPSGGQRPLQAVARPCFVPGLFYVPEVGQPIWVEFAAGDINSPIWSGVWYPDEGTPATVDEDHPTEDQKVIRTVSGQVVQLEDTGGTERLVLRDELNDNRVVLDADGISFEDANGNVVTLDGSGIRLEDGNGNVVTLDSNGVRLEAGGCTIELGGTAITVTNGVHTFEMGPTGTKVTDATTGGPHALVLAPVLQWLTTHQHMGNMGAPAPLFPSDLATILPHDLAGTGKSGL